MTLYCDSKAGAVKALQELHNLDTFSLTGASAGAVVAVLAGCKVDMDYALNVAERSIEFYIHVTIHV